MKLMSFVSSSAFILALALPALAAERRGDTIAPTDDKAAEADTFMNAKVIAIKRDTIEFRDNDGKKRTLALQEGAKVEHAVKPGANVILVIKGKAGDERVTAVKRSLGGGSGSSALMNTDPIYIPAPTGSREYGTLTLGPTNAARPAPLVRIPVNVEVNPRDVAPRPETAASSSLAAAQMASGVGAMPQPPVGGYGGTNAAGSAAANNNPYYFMNSGIVGSGALAAAAATTDNTTTTTAAGRVPITQGSLANPLPGLNNTTGGGTITAAPDQAVILGSAPNPNTGGVAPLPPTGTTTGSTTGTNTSAPIGSTVPNFTNANLPGAGISVASSTQGSATVAAIVNLPVSPGIIRSDTVPTVTNTSVGAIRTGALVGTASGFFGAPYATQQTGVGTSATIGSTQQGGGAGGTGSSLGADASPLPMGLAVQFYQSAVARAAMESVEVDRAFTRYKDSCVGPRATISTGTGGRDWFDVWDGTNSPADTREQCAPLLAQAVRIGHEVQANLSAAEDAARISGVLPGVMRQIRTMYGMDWGGWDR